MRRQRVTSCHAGNERKRWCPSSWYVAHRHHHSDVWIAEVTFCGLPMWRGCVVVNWRFGNRIRLAQCVYVTLYYYTLLYTTSLCTLSMSHSCHTQATLHYAAIVQSQHKHADAAHSNFQ